MAMGKKLIFDLDGTICSQEKNYADAKPFYNIIKKINQEYKNGNTIIIYTARGTETGIDWTDVTINQLKRWGVCYDDLYFGKIAGDLYIDDKGINIDNWQTDIQYQSKVIKEWGIEYWLAQTNQYIYKRLEIFKDKNISKQYHQYKHETWHIIQGQGIGLFNDETKILKAGMTIVIPPYTIHQAKALTDKLIIMEVSTPQFNDIIRLEKGFNSCIS